MASRGFGGSPFHVVLLAGGSGTRFWPLSRKNRPKQFLSLAGDRPLLARTWSRMRQLVPPSRLWVVAPAALRGEIVRLLPRLRTDRLIVEPSPRDTGPAVALACAAVGDVAPKAVVGLFPTDHIIPDEAAFERSVAKAIKSACDGSLVCLGIRPDRPATGFGYLKCAEYPRGGRASRVERFIEKPDVARARAFVRSGRYLWNGGMFVWGVERFGEELRRTAPRILHAVQRFRAGESSAWERAPRLSIDYAVMEKARDVRVVPLAAGWNDLGSWDAAAAVVEAEGSKRSKELLVDSPGSVVFGNERIVAVVDVPDVAIVDTPDALLIVSRRSSEKVREIVARLKRRGRSDLL